jgi:hypothetical protein
MSADGYRFEIKIGRNESLKNIISSKFSISFF